VKACGRQSSAPYSSKTLIEFQRTTRHYIQEDNTLKVKIDYKEMYYEGVKLIQIIHNNGQWRTRGAPLIDYPLLVIQCVPVGSYHPHVLSCKGGLWGSCVGGQTELS
jgi:hypothetical protein